MGTWGFDILADDDAMDVYEAYRRFYNEGDDHSVVREKLERDCAELLRDTDLSAVFWMAVAKAQWEYGALDSDVLSRVTEIMERGSGMDRWQDSGDKAVAKRQKAIADFVQKISQPNPKPKKRKVEKKYPAIFQPGDCLALTLPDGTFGAAFVVAIDNSNDVEGLDYVGLLEYRSSDKPSADVFQERRWIQPPPIGPFLPSVNVFQKVLARTYRREGKGVERLFQLPLMPSDTRHKGKIIHVGGWGTVLFEIDLYYQLQSFDDPLAREAYFKIQYYALRVTANTHSEIEPLLLAGYDELKARQTGIRPVEQRQILSRAAQQLLDFYEAWHKSDEVARWRTELEQIK